VLSNRKGQLPLAIGNLTELIEIDLMNVDLSFFSAGTVPDSIGLCTKLVKVRFDKCKLQGQFPTGLRTLKSLGMISTKCNEIEYLDFNTNAFKGPIPHWICELVSLTVLNLHNNQFTDLIPECIGSLKILMSLELGVNHFTGELPIGICDLSKLETVRIYNTNIIGMILFSNAKALYPHA
jgi:Leucine-rich repeat (LRR) protein